MKVTTGFGYYVRDGEARMKYELPIGNHPDPVGYTFVETDGKASLASVSVSPEKSIDND
jgi:hypothetical protein